MRLFTRSLRPPEDVTPNANDPAAVPPSTVGPDQLVVPGDPHGVVLEGPGAPSLPPPRIVPSPWSGWPADWYPPLWNSGRLTELADTAWMCLDLNSQIFSDMPPYLVGAARTLDADWLRNPDPDLYAAGWNEFAKQLLWDYQLGEAFVLATAYYATGWPARFHVVPPWSVNVELAGVGRRYTIGSVDVTDDILHIRYQGSVDDAHGHGPLEAGQARIIAAKVLTRYGTQLAAAGGIPSSILTHPEQLSPEQAMALQQQWVAARLSTLGEPAVLSGGISWEQTQMSPTDMALLDLLTFNESRIAVLLGVPPHMVGLPSGGEPMTYSNVTSIYDYHWRAGLRPKAGMLMAALSEWLLPRGTRIEVNRDAYVQPEPLARAQTAEILNRIVDEDGRPALSVAEIRLAERLDNSTPTNVGNGVLR